MNITYPRIRYSKEDFLVLVPALLLIFMGFHVVVVDPWHAAYGTNLFLSVLMFPLRTSTAQNSQPCQMWVQITSRRDC